MPTASNCRLVKNSFFFYTEILTRKVILLSFFTSEMSERNHNSIFRIKILVYRTKFFLMRWKSNQDIWHVLFHRIWKSHLLIYYFNCLYEPVVYIIQSCFYNFNFQKIKNYFAQVWLLYLVQLGVSLLIYVELRKWSLWSKTSITSLKIFEEWLWSKKNIKQSTWSSGDGGKCTVL